MPLNCIFHPWHRNSSCNTIIRKRSEIAMNQKALPIIEIERSIQSSIARQNRLVIQAPTGSGKSTQVPRILLESGNVEGIIVVLQPRRIAARMLAVRVSQEMNTPLGDMVGFRMRFENRTSPNTRIVFMTEGTLFRQLTSDRTLEGIGAVVFDEFHERSLYSDLLLSFVRTLQQSSRPDLRIVVMSATLDTGPVASFLDSCPVLTAQGRMFPVDIRYIGKDYDYRSAGMWSVAAQHLERLLPDIPEGDILIFMPGAYEISRTIRELESNRLFSGFDIVPLHGELPLAQQQRAVEHAPGKRSIIVSTNVAQTSLTIEGITAVVDSGYARVARYDPSRGIDTLYVERISASAADQRAGRAGRVRPGVCLRLWTEQEQASRSPQDVPEVRRVDLAEALLGMHAAGITDPAGFPWFEPPQERSLERAQTLLHDLGSVDGSGRLTETGKAQIRFPLHPRYSRMLLEGHRRRCLTVTALAAALTQERSILIRARSDSVRTQREYHIPSSPSSDLIYLINAFLFVRERGFDIDICTRLGIHRNSALQVEKVFGQLMAAVQKTGVAEEKVEDTEKGLALSVLAGFSDHLAKRISLGTSRCELVHGRRGDLAPESGVRKAQLFVSCDIREIEKSRGELLVRLSMNTAVEQKWLRELFADDFCSRRSVHFDQRAKKVVCEMQMLFRDLVLESHTKDEPTDDEAAAVLTEEIMKGTIHIPTWNHEVEQYVARINSAALWCPDWQVSPVDDGARELIFHQYCLGARSLRQLKDRPVLPFIKQWLSSMQREMIEKHLPERLELPSGRRVKLRYSTDGSPPVAGIMIQQLYEMDKQPAVACGAAPVLIEILAPNHRPVQVTSDIRGFFRDTYPELKKQLSRRYPKHEWR